MIKRSLSVATLSGLLCILFQAPGMADTTAPDTSVASSSSLPLFRELAAGYDLPEPYGIGVNYMGIRQGIQVDSIRFSGMKLGSLPLDNLVKIRAGNTRQKSHTETLRLDAWVLPFMNVYGLIGRTKGQSVSAVSISAPAFGGTFPSALSQDLVFRLNYKGTTRGVGTTLVGGSDNWFASLDANYTQTRFDVLDGHINALTVTPRVGYYITTPSVNLLPEGRLSVWVGSMYQDVQQDFRGRLDRVRMPSATLQKWLGRLNKNGDARFEVKQHLKTPWNILTGVRYDVTRHLSLTAEAGFERRDSFLVSGEYRF